MDVCCFAAAEATTRKRSLWLSAAIASSIGAVMSNVAPAKK